MCLCHAPTRFRALLLGATLLGAALAARPAAAQARAPAAGAYFGPRYPGGPDSLRAVVRRGLRPANPAWVGNVFLQLQLGATGAVQQVRCLTPPPGTPAAALVRTAEVQALATRVVRQLAHWQSDPGVMRLASWRYDTWVLLLPFGLPGPAPLAYADTLPTFAVPGQRPQGDYPSSVAAFVRRQFRYPAEALRTQTQGIVSLYFEVSETGAIEQAQVVGSLSPSVDAEALRVLKLLPAASTPPRQQGRAVRVYYVVPLTVRLP